MKIIRYKTGKEPAYGVLNDDDSIADLIGSPFDEFYVGRKVAVLDEVQQLPPVNPSKIICVGLNYLSHIKELDLPTPKFPMLFMKPNTSLIGPNDPIVYPYKSTHVDYEAELVAVIGKETRHVSEEDALDYVLGYTCGNDVSERTIQFAEMKNGAMLIGKGFDTFCPLGPVIDTSIDPTSAGVMARLNGTLKQNSNTSDLLFSVAKLVSYISEAMLLLPGDVIFTGTPAGVSPITPGDTVEIEISGVGILQNPVIKEEQ